MLGRNETVRLHGQHRARSVSHDRIGDASHDELRDYAAIGTAEDDQINLSTAGVVHNRVVGAFVNDLTFDMKTITLYRVEQILQTLERISLGLFAKSIEIHRGEHRRITRDVLNGVNDVQLGTRFRRQSLRVLQRGRR